MKRVSLLVTISFLVALSLVIFGVGGCAGTGVSQTDLTTSTTGDLHVVTSFLPMYILTANLVTGIEGVSLENLASPDTGCLHDYRLLPGDLISLAKADVFIINGAGMEGFLGDLAESRPDLRQINASEGIEMLPGIEGDFNPHVWLSVPLAIRQVHQISEGLQQLDPAHASQYQVNERAYITRLQTMHERIQMALEPLAGTRIITFHEAFSYFAAEYGLAVEAVIAREPGSEPTAAELAQTINLIRDTGIKALFAEPQYPLKIAETIALETGAKVFLLDPVVTGEEAADTYEKVMEQNLQTLLQALR
jgi:zinc transport system substrate-binding protein